MCIAVPRVPITNFLFTENDTLLFEINNYWSIDIQLNGGTNEGSEQ